MYQHDSAIESESLSFSSCSKDTGSKPDDVKDTYNVNDDEGETSANVLEINNESNVEDARGTAAEEFDSDTTKDDFSAHVSQLSTEGGKSDTESDVKCDDSVEPDMVKELPGLEMPGAFEVASCGEFRHNDEDNDSEIKEGKQSDEFQDAEVNNSNDSDKTVSEGTLSNAEVKIVACDSSELSTETENDISVSEQEKVSDGGEVELSETNDRVECNVTTETSPHDSDAKDVTLSSEAETSPGVGINIGEQEGEELQASDNVNTCLMTESTSSEADSDSDIFMDAVEETESHEALREPADVTSEQHVRESPPLIVIHPDSDSDEKVEEEIGGATVESAESELTAAESVSDRDRFKSASEELLTDKEDQKEVELKPDVEKETVLSNNPDEETEDVSEDELNPPLDASAAMSKGKLEKTGEGTEADARDDGDEKGHSSEGEEHSDPETEESEVDVEEDDELCVNEVEKNPGTVLVLDRPELRHDPNDDLKEPYSDVRLSGVGEELIQEESHEAEKADLEATEKADEPASPKQEESTGPPADGHKDFPETGESVASVEEEVTSKDDQAESESVEQDASGKVGEGADVSLLSMVAETEVSAETEQTCATSDKTENENLSENKSKVSEHSPPQGSSKDDQAEEESVSGDTANEQPKTDVPEPDAEGEVVKRKKSGRRSKKSQKSSKRKSTSSVHRSDSYHVANKHDEWQEEESKSVSEDEVPETDLLLEDIQKVTEKEDLCQKRNSDAGTLTDVKDDVKSEDADVDSAEGKSQGGDPGVEKDQSVTKEEACTGKESVEEGRLLTPKDTAKQEYETDKDDPMVSEPVATEASGVLADEEEEEDGTEYTLDDIDLDEGSEKYSDLASVDSGTASKENLTTDGSDSFVSPTDSEKGFPTESGLGASACLKASVSKDSVISDTGGKVDGAKSEQKKTNNRQKGRAGNRTKGFVEELKLPPPSGEEPKGNSPVPLERKKRSRKSRRERPKGEQAEAEEPEPVKTPDSKGQKPGSGFFKKIFGRT
ncbi:dentin sialophosphoprotein-like [Liolophura sinensis]|uniref:dentin sialophosphoprotein-like n=1 Tax=Liolophura sinensis TaxID=3198878 RepID=UPI00315869B4